MADLEVVPNRFRLKLDGSNSSICLQCLRTIKSDEDTPDLRECERLHVCSKF